MSTNPVMAGRREPWTHYDSVRPSPVPDQCSHQWHFCYVAGLTGSDGAQQDPDGPVSLCPNPAARLHLFSAHVEKIAETSVPLVHL